MRTMLYSDKVLDHFENPRNVGEIPDANAVGLVGNAKCGDIMQMFMKIENDVIVDVKFKTFGCGANRGVLVDGDRAREGKTIEEALQLTNKSVMEALDGLPPVKMHVRCLPSRPSAPHYQITTSGRDRSRPILGEIKESNIEDAAVTARTALLILCIVHKLMPSKL